MLNADVASGNCTIVIKTEALAETGTEENIRKNVSAILKSFYQSPSL